VRISLDLDSTTPAVVGARAGVPPHRLQALTGALADLLARLSDAEGSGLLPHLTLARQPGGMARWVAHGAAWSAPGRKRNDRLVLVGEPGAVDAARLLAPPGTGRALAVVDRPDPRQVAAAFDGAKRPRVIALLGPRWIGELTGLLAERAAAVTVFDGEAEGAVLPDAEQVTVAGAADPRFGFLSPASLSVAGFGGVSPDALVAAAGAGLAACTDPAVRHNPAARLGALAAHLAVIEGLPVPLLLSPDASLDRFAAWASGAWAAITCRLVPVPSGQAPRGAAPLVARLGDEAMIQRSLAGSRDLWAVSLRASGDDGHGPVAALRGRLADAQRRQLVEDGRPVARLSVSGGGPPARLALALVWVQAALIAAALDPVDPLSMDAADDWRDRIASAPS